MGKRILTIVFATLMAMVTFTACSDNDEPRNDTRTGEKQGRSTDRPTDSKYRPNVCG